MKFGSIYEWTWDTDSRHKCESKIDRDFMLCRVISRCIKCQWLNLDTLFFIIRDKAVYKIVVFRSFLEVESTVYMYIDSICRITRIDSSWCIAFAISIDMFISRLSKYKNLIAIASIVISIPRWICTWRIKKWITCTDAIFTNIFSDSLSDFTRRLRKFSRHTKLASSIGRIKIYGNHHDTHNAKNCHRNREFYKGKSRWSWKTRHSILLYPVGKSTSSIILTKIWTIFHNYSSIDNISSWFSAFIENISTSSTLLKRQWNHPNITRIETTSIRKSVSISSVCIEIEPGTLPESSCVWEIEGYFFHRNGWSLYFSCCFIECHSWIWKVIFYEKNSWWERIFQACIWLNERAVPRNKVTNICVSNIFDKLDLFSQKIGNNNLVTRVCSCSHDTEEKCVHSRKSDWKYRHTDDDLDQRESRWVSKTKFHDYWRYGLRSISRAWPFSSCHWLYPIERKIPVEENNILDPVKNAPLA